LTIEKVCQMSLVRQTFFVLIYNLLVMCGKRFRRGFYYFINIVFIIV
jgi:hypothetical protein